MICIVYHVCWLCAAWRQAQEAAELARLTEHDKWAEAKRLGQQADEATANRLSVMRERVTELKEEMETVKEEVTAASSSSSTTTRVLTSHKVDDEGSSDAKVHVQLKGKGGQGVQVKVSEE